VHEHRTAVYAARVRTWQRQALERLDPSSRLAARLVARVAAESDYEQGTATAVLAAVDDARAGADAVLLADTLNLAHHCLLGPEHAEHRLALARELLAVSAVTGRVVDETLGLLWLTVDLLLAGDPHAGRPLRELRAANEAHGLRAVEYVLSAMDVMLAIRRGDLADAERQAAACVELGQAVGDVDASGWYGAHLSAIRWFQGRTVELIPLLTELAHSPTLAGPDDSFFAALAVAAAAAGDRPAAVHALRCLRRDGLGNLLRSSTWRVSLFGVIEAAHLLDDAQTAAEAYRLLEPYADQPIMASLAIVCFGSAHHPLGVAAETMGDLDLADRHLTAAVSANEVLGHLPAAALSSQRLAEVKRRQDELVRGGRGAMATCRRQGGSW
jgi:hypothetical protein